jgi:hypothetical protein
MDSRAVLLLLRKIFQRFPDKDKKEMHELKYEGKIPLFLTRNTQPTKKESKSHYNYQRKNLIIYVRKKFTFLVISR